ncbi:MAG TPA: cytidine deaminase, partial [Sulfurospirillum arcachonense]|nr:cytidine deaminase [Sulfurospirillum arcachonense]
ENGNIYNGCNVENAAYPSGSCAEEQAIGNMIVNGGKIIKEILIIGKSDELLTPCGACRQRIREFCDETTKIHICHISNGLQKSFTIGTLLPYSFGPENL